MRLKSGAAGVLIVGLAVLASCGEGGGGSGQEKVPPGDHFFKSVVAGDSELDGPAEVVLFDPNLAGQRGSKATLGRTPDKLDALVLLHMADGTELRMEGEWTKEGAYSASGSHPTTGDSYSVNGTFSGGHTTAQILGPEESSATLGGEDIMDGGEATAFCGSYEGSSSGTWNFVVSRSGGLTGAFSRGGLSGSASGSSVSIQWGFDASGLCKSGGSGHASGSVSASQTVSGTWGGTGCGDAVEGSWTGQKCSGGATTEVDDSYDKTSSSADPDFANDPPEVCNCGKIEVNDCCPPGGVCCMF